MKKYPILKTFSKIIGIVFAKDKKIFIFFTIFTIVASIYPLFAVYMPKLMIGELVKTNPDFTYLVYVVVGFIGLTALCGFLEAWTQDVCRPRLVMLRIDYLAEAYNKFNQLDYHYMEDPTFLDSIEDALQAVAASNTGLEGILHRMFAFFARALTIIFYVMIIGQLSYIVLLALALSLLISVLISVYIRKYQFKRKDELAHASRKIRYYSETTHDFSYGKDVRMYRFQDKIETNYRLEIANYMGVFRKIRNKEYKLGFIELLFVLLSDAVLYYILVTKVLDGMPIADFSMFLVAAVALSTLFKIASEDIAFLIGEGQYMHAYYQYMNKEYNMPNEGLKKIEGDTLEIVFDNVSFKYPKTDKWILRNVSFTINKKEKLAIVGINGAGKTTIVKLITRLFEPTEGKILINGRNIADYDKHEYMKMFSVVFQDINVLAFSVRENLSLQHSNDEQRMWECLEKVGLKEKVQNFEQGLDHPLLKVVDEKGAILSGGENQKLVIARALYKNGNAIILDEPTAALDALAEAEIYQNFNQLIENKTAIYISHRLASTKFCDRIALFKESSLYEYGTHQELMDLRGEYYTMFTVQGKYYQEEQQYEAN